jgi:hypothetical protein
MLTNFFTSSVCRYHRWSYKHKSCFWRRGMPLDGFRESTENWALWHFFSWYQSLPPKLFHDVFYVHFNESEWPCMVIGPWGYLPAQTGCRDAEIFMIWRGVTWISYNPLTMYELPPRSAPSSLRHRVRHPGLLGYCVTPHTSEKFAPKD